MRFYLFPLLTLFYLTACATTSTKKPEAGTGEEMVEASGSCPILEGDVAGAKTCSLREAQREAVERVVGVFISAKTRVENAVAIDQNILARSEGYISRYEILAQRKEGNFFQTRIRAWVRVKEVGENLRTLEILKHPAVRQPRIAVLLEERAGFTDLKTALPTTHALMETLLAGGYKVVEPEIARGTAALPQFAPLLRGETAIVTAVGSHLGAELLIVGEAIASPVRMEDLDLTGMESYRASVSARIYRAATGEALEAVSAQAFGLDVTKEAAYHKALGAAGKKVGEKVARILAQRLLQRASVAVTLQNVRDFRSLERFQKQLSALPEIREYYLRSFGENTAVLDIYLNPAHHAGTQELAATMTKKMGITVKSSEDNALIIFLK